MSVKSNITLSENSLALPGKSQELAFPGQEEWEQMKKMAELLVKSRFLPSHIQTPEQAIAIFLNARELGIPPMQAIRSMFVHRGIVGMNGSLLMGLILRSGLAEKFEFEEGEDYVELTVKRKDINYERTVRWDMKRAQMAGLLSKDNWKHHPKTMLKWRCVAEIAREMFADIGLGAVYTMEEMDEIKGSQPESPLEVDQIEPIEVTALEPEVEIERQPEEEPEPKEGLEQEEKPEPKPKKKKRGRPKKKMAEVEVSQEKAEPEIPFTEEELEGIEEIAEEVEENDDVIILPLPSLCEAAIEDFKKGKLKEYEFGDRIVNTMKGWYENIIKYEADDVIVNDLRELYKMIQKLEFKDMEVKAVILKKIAKYGKKVSPNKK